MDSARSQYDSHFGNLAPSWEDIACPLCRARNEFEILQKRSDGPAETYRLVKCGQCGMGYLNPRPIETEIGRYYQESYGPYQAPPTRRLKDRPRLRQYLESLVRSHYFGYPPPLRHFRDRLAARIARWTLRPDRGSLTHLPYHGEGRLLDFGCGSGWYAHRMKERGWQVTGLDFSSHAAKQVEKLFGIPVHVGTLPHPDLKPQSFDMITMGAVLEHVHDPHQVVGAAATLLKPGGRLVIAVPNWSSWGFRFFGPYWWGLELPRHLLHFTPATLARLIKSHGLIVRELTTLVRGGWLRRSMALVRQDVDAPVSRRWLSALGRVRPLASLMARITGWTNQADCLKLIAELPLAPSLSQAA